MTYFIHNTLMNMIELYDNCLSECLDSYESEYISSEDYDYMYKYFNELICYTRKFYDEVNYTESKA